MEGEQRPGGIVCVRHTAGEVGPGPAARVGVRVDVPLAVLLVEKPTAQGGAIGRPEEAVPIGPARQRVDAERGDPRGQVRVDGPASVGPHRTLQERHAAIHHRVCRFPGGDEAHDDEARQRRRLQEAAAVRLDRLQAAQGGSAGRAADEPRQRIARGSLPVPGLSDGDQGGQGIADHWEPQPAVPGRRDRGQLERELRHVPPAAADGAPASALRALVVVGARAGASRVSGSAAPRRVAAGVAGAPPIGIEEAGQREHRENGYGERAVPPVPPTDRVGERPRFQAAGGAVHPAAHSVERRHGPRSVRPGEGEGRPAESRRADVARAVGGVAPAAVLVLGSDQPRDAVTGERIARGVRSLPLDERECDGRDGSRQRRRRQLADPVAVRGSSREQMRCETVQGCTQPGVNWRRCGRLHESASARVR